MIQVRQGVFETNSSSVHSIAIPKELGTIPKTHLIFKFDEFGWGREEVDPCDYLYTAMHEFLDREDFIKGIYHIQNLLNAHGITYEFLDFDEIEYGEEDDDYYKYGYIDHSKGLGPFLADVLGDDNRLLAFLLGGVVHTGNDNDLYDTEIPEESWKYDIYYKGN